ncbi:alpha/beta-Hydrolases superfamily protein [Rhynchospora pubera]|uniref:Alpha/beta-Hydrolases superfamily protein n=1 Tax=Rhynchospora pubera TaxID=906938 RepID=A0AAV8GHB9_9POAL|nr:alpha/beta-Hydrolases superfamily protein [Rhynchospora pubera]
MDPYKELGLSESKDPFKVLGLTVNQDGTISRSSIAPLSPAFPDGESLPGATATVSSKDVPLNPSHDTTVRLFLPSLPPSKSLPLIIYFHGGGFVLFHAASTPMHTSCAHLAASLPAVVASVDYRLAPEHRLPAAFDDARDALHWAQSAVSSEPWVRDFVDPTKLFLMGSSAGGNICYHAALDLISTRLDIRPLRLSGLILNQPYFGGIDRTASELAFADDKVVSLPVTDLLWELALPLGSNRDHEYSNVVAKEAKEVKFFPPCLVRGLNEDPLFDRQKLFVEMLIRAGVTVVAKMGSSGHHGVEYLNPEKAAEMATDVKNFVYGEAELSSVPKQDLINPI